MKGTREPGISTLLACQDEEAVVGLSIVSFLPFSDEIVVVDNGSSDRSPEICRSLAEAFPGRVRFHQTPHLRDLHENRQYAFERSRYRWVVRADADYVCYTDGPRDIRKLRQHILARRPRVRPQVYYLPQPSLCGDFLHTREAAAPHPMPRVYQVFPGFRFVRLGRWEGARFNRWLRRVYWPEPVWMHVDVKSDRNYFRRSERTNWRETGDRKKYPDLASYLRAVIPDKYGTGDMKEAQQQYLARDLWPRLESYREEDATPYPSVLRSVMDRYPVYTVRERGEGIERDYSGPVDTDVLIGIGRDLCARAGRA